MSAGRDDPLFQAWADRARGVDLVEAALDLGFRPKGGARPGRGELVGPCPRCGGRDRFSIHRGKGVWHCRAAGIGGGDAISLARYVMGGASFVEACERLTGEARPDRPTSEAEREAARARQARSAADDAARRAQALRAEAEFRLAERTRCHALWRAGAPIAGTLAEAYLVHRTGLPAPPGAKLRFHPDIRLTHPPGLEGRVVWTGPALIAAIVDNAGRFIGLHRTWLDPRLGEPGYVPPADGKLSLVVDGERLDVKRARGSARGGHLVVAPAAGRLRRLVIGEGIETTLAVRAALLEAGEGLEDTAFWTAISLGNLGGPAARTVAHPSETFVDRAGRTRKRRIPGPEPDLSEPDRAIALPAEVEEALILADGDCDAALVAHAATRAATRWAAPGRIVRAAWPEPGGDFCDMRMAALGRARGGAAEAPREMEGAA